MMMEVVHITRDATKPFLLGIHYAKRMPSISHAFGLLVEGVVTYGTPPSSTLRSGLCGDEYIQDILELNRLCLKNNEKNHASFLVAKSMRMLPPNKVIISFADTSQGHKGVVYQATNFMYCGLSAKRTDWKLRGKEHLHGQTVADEFRGQPQRAKLMREKYGDDFYLEPRPRKHRYVRMIGSKKFKKAATSDLRYDVLDFPK